MTTRPCVSVVIPCYNYGHFLPEAVASALNQPGVDVEIIIVDDCSTDGSELVAKELETAHPEVRVMRNEVNLRHIATYNRGLAEVNGDYVVLLSADDLLAPGALSRASSLMEACPEVGLVYGYAPDFAHAPPPTSLKARTWSTWTGDEWLRRMAARGDNLIVNPEAMLRGSLLSELGGYDATFPHAADMLLWMRAAACAGVGRVNGTQAYYREHGANMHRTDYAGLITDMRERLSLFRMFFIEGDGASRVDAQHLLTVGGRSIAIEAMWNACLAAQSSTPAQDDSAADFAELAKTAWPDVVHHRLWRAWRRRMSAPTSRISARTLSVCYSMRWKVRWRRWRHLGT